VRREREQQQQLPPPQEPIGQGGVGEAAEREEFALRKAEKLARQLANDEDDEEEEEGGGGGEGRGSRAPSAASQASASALHALQAHQASHGSAAPVLGPGTGRGLHSSSYQLNLSRS